MAHHVANGGSFCVTGFVGSGPLVILADVTLGIGPRPSHRQRLALFSFVTAVTCCGAACP